MKISASVLACNTLDLKENLKIAEQAGIDYIHVDIMDGDYVENFTYGPQFITELRNVVNVPIEVHLEVARADKYIDMFCNAGAHRIIIQRDGCMNPIRTLNKIKKYGIKAGIGLNPADSVENLAYILNYADFIVIMSVEPGFGGQPFEISCYEKIIKLKKIMKESDHFLPILVDGGVNEIIAQKLVNYGVKAAVIGTAIFGAKNVRDAVITLKKINPDNKLNFLKAQM